MEDATVYCDKMYKQLIGLKAGLYDVISAAENVGDATHADQAKQLRSLVDGIEKGLDELKNQCPADWSPNKKSLDESMDRLSKALNEMAGHLDISVPDTTAWI